MISEKIEKEKIEKKLEKFLGIDAGELRNEIINKAVWLKKDYSKMVAVRIFDDESYVIDYGQEGSFEDLDEGFRFEFSLIEPWDLPDYESVSEKDEGGWLDQDNGDEFEDDDELLEAVRNTISSGFYGRFEEEWKKFLLAFQEWRNP